MLVSGTWSEPPRLRTLTLLLRLLTNRQFAEELMNKVCCADTKPWWLKSASPKRNNNSTQPFSCMALATSSTGVLLPRRVANWHKRQRSLGLNYFFSGLLRSLRDEVHISPFLPIFSCLNCPGKFAHFCWSLLSKFHAYPVTKKKLAQMTNIDFRVLKGPWFFTNLP